MQHTEKFKWLLIALYYSLHNVECASRIDALVDTKVGLIRGLQASDGDYAMFMGIPYAKVEEQNPFGPSVPYPKFDEVFEAYDDSAVCPQVNDEIIPTVKSLDCLHLNVYVPNTASSRNRLPVLVWIYGGGFSTGYSGRNIYGPSYLVRHDVILVTLNYRVGPYGFMCLNIPTVPGNQGLKDQQLALKWVKDNIEEFGGDVNEITIFGESAGGASVDFHLYYTNEKLFNKVILQSGNAFCPWTVLEPDRASPLKLANHLGFESNDVENALAFLSETDPKLVIAATEELDLVFRPCVENDFEEVDKFIGNHPINTDISRVKDFPILIGYNDKESLSFIKEDVGSIQNIFNSTLVNYFNFEKDELTEMENMIRHFYIGDEVIDESTIMSIVDFDSDFTFIHPSVRSINRYIENGAEAVFHYVFSYNSGRNFGQNLYDTNEDGAAHADEIGYLFDQAFVEDEPTPEDQQMINLITTLWTNFAKTGNPTPEASTLPVTWTPVTVDSMSYLSIGSEVHVQQRPFNERMAFWDLFYKLNKKAQKGYLDD